jgi:glycerol uptake facilitator-like aquaporin
MTDTWRRASAEFVGTLVLVLACCGAIFVNSHAGALCHVGVVLTFGLATIYNVYALLATQTLKHLLRLPALRLVALDRRLG